jgi:hypothetical protein
MSSGPGGPQAPAPAEEARVRYGFFVVMLCLWILGFTGLIVSFTRSFLPLSSTFGMYAVFAGVMACVYVLYAGIRRDRGDSATAFQSYQYAAYSFLLSIGMSIFFHIERVSELREKAKAGIPF